MSDPAPRLGLAVLSLLVCAGYYLGTLLGYAFIFPSSYISIVWPPNTILLVALLLSPRRHWAWLLAIAFPVHLLAQAQFGVSLTMASLYYVYDCGLLLITAGALRWFGLDTLDLRELRQALIFIAVTTIAVAVGTLIWSPLIVSIWVGGDIWEPWTLVFLSNLLAVPVRHPGPLDRPQSRRQPRKERYARAVHGIRPARRGTACVRNRNIRTCARVAPAPAGALLCAAAIPVVGGRALRSRWLVFRLPDLRRDGDVQRDRRLRALRHAIRGRKRSQDAALPAGPVCPPARAGIRGRGKTGPRKRPCGKARPATGRWSRIKRS